VAHGRLYPLDVEFEEHPNGRCTLVPVFDYDDEWAPQLDGQNWFRSQPEAIQREILGPGRYDLYSKGEVGFNQLATLKEDSRWGNSIVRTPVNQLKRGEGGIPFIPTRTMPSPYLGDMLPASTPEASQTLASLEEKIRNIHSHEQAYLVGMDGRLVAHVLGEAGSVNIAPSLRSFTDAEKATLIQTHNHPSGFAAFSDADLRVFFKTGIKEVRAVSVDGTSSFRHADLKGKRLTSTWFERTYKKLAPSIRDEVTAGLRSGALSRNASPHSYFMDRMAKALAEESKGKLIYERFSTTHR